MSSIQTTVDWRKKALFLANHAKQLDPEKPAIIHIRHSERPQMPLEKDAFKMALSTRGESTSRAQGEFS
jgi:hypothetical protein